MALVEIVIRDAPRNRQTGWIFLNRPEQRNALSVALRDELISALNDIAISPTIDIAVISGRGNCFSAGFDLKEALTTDLETFDYRFNDFFDALYRFPKILIAMVRGFAFAGGFDTVLAADLIIAEEQARFGHPEVLFGVMPLLTPLWRRVGISRAFEMGISGDIIDAQLARNIGLITRAVPPEELIPTTEHIIEHLSTLPQHLLREMKQIRQSIHLMTPETAAYIELKAFRRLANNDEVIGKLEAYLHELSTKNNNKYSIGPRS